MRTRFTSLNSAVTLGIIAFLTVIARLTFLDALYVPEFRVLLPENQPATTALMMLVYMILVGVWVWSLLASSRGSRAGLMMSLIFSLMTAFGGGLLTLTLLCPNGCAAPPVGNGIVWANLITGIAASLALGRQLIRMRRSSANLQNAVRGKTA